MRQHGHAHIVPGFPAVRWGKSGVASAPPPPGDWTPSELGSALRAHYDFSLLTGSDGDPQGAVSDLSGNGFDLSAAGGLRPTLQAANLNGLNTLRWTAASSQRYALSTSILSGSSAGAMYMVFKVISESVNNGLMNWGTSGSDSHWPFSDGVQYNDFGATARKTVGNPSVSLTSTYRIIRIYSAASDWKFFIDGGAGGSSGGTTAFFSTATNTVGWASSGVNLGANAGLTAFLDGRIAELFFANATTDGQKAEGYLAHKWGLTGELDSAHPYKSSPPTV